MTYRECFGNSSQLARTVVKQKCWPKHNVNRKHSYEAIFEILFGG